VRVEELVHQARLAHPRFPHDCDKLALPTACAFQRLTKGFQLHLPSDEAGEAARDGRLQSAPNGCRADQLKDFDQLRQPLHRHWSQRLDLNESLRELQRLAGQQDAPWRRELLHGGGQVRRLADGGVVHVQVVADGPHHHLPAVEAHAHLHRDAVRAPHLLAVAADGLLHRQAPITRPHRMILMRQRGAEQRHDPIAHDLVDGALVAVHRGHHALQHRVEELAGLLGVAVGEQLHRALEVSEQHRDLLAFSFEGAFGGEDFLGEIGGRVAEWRVRAGSHW
jgi:hypothetical protein